MENVFLITLEPIVDLSTIASLHAKCTEALASDLSHVYIDASQVERLKTPIFQLILCLQKSLIMQNRSLELVSPSEGFILLARRLGLHVPLQLEQIKAGNT